MLYASLNSLVFLVWVLWQLFWRDEAEPAPPSHSSTFASLLSTGSVRRKRSSWNIRAAVQMTTSNLLCEGGQSIQIPSDPPARLPILPANLQTFCLWLFPASFRLPPINSLPASISSFLSVKINLPAFESFFSQQVTVSLLEFEALYEQLTFSSPEIHSSFLSRGSCSPLFFFF